MINRTLAASAAAIAIVASVPAQARAQERTYSFNIPAGDLGAGIRTFAKESHQQVSFDGALVEGKHSNEIQGSYAPEQALARLLEGTGVTFRRADRGVFILSAVGNGIDSRSLSSAAATPDILVLGRRTLNADIRRTRDDIQPYVVFTADQINLSGASNLEDFLASHLPMNAQQGSTLEDESGSGNFNSAGGINLRGLGPRQTLILVDGRRLASASTGNSYNQPNIIGVPMSAIERVEILPSTASGIYGGGATGGVVNIILKKNYVGFDLDATYGNAFDTGVSQKQISLSGGFTLEHGRTHVTLGFAGKWAGKLLNTDRDFDRRSTELQLHNSGQLSSVGQTSGPNICSTINGFSCGTTPLVLKNGTPLNSAFTFVPGGYSGPSADGGAALAANAGDLRFDQNFMPLWDSPRSLSVSFGVRRQFTPGIEAFLDLSHDDTRGQSLAFGPLLQHVSSSSPNNPFLQDVLVTVPILPSEYPENSNRISNTRIYAGTIFRLPHRWGGTLEYDWLRSASRADVNEFLSTDPSAASQVEQAVFRAGSINPLPASDFDLFSSSAPNGDTRQIASLRLSGPILTLPGGDLTLSSSIELDEEKLDDVVVKQTQQPSPPRFLWDPSASTRSASAYAEIRAPIVSEKNSSPLLRALELTGAVRHEIYRSRFLGSSISVASQDGPFPAEKSAINRFTSTNYTLGLRYAPSDFITFRASAGTGFLPPQPYQIRGSSFVVSGAIIRFFGILDPKRGNTSPPGAVTFLSGGNPDIKPEQSRSFSYGFVFTPKLLKTFRLSVDVTHIHKTDEILGPPIAFLLANESQFPGRIVRGPNLPGDLPGWAGPITEIDESFINFAKSKVTAVDVQADYDVKTSDLGNWHLYLVGTYQPKLIHQAITGTAPFNQAGTFFGPVKVRGNFGLDWTKAAWTLGWNSQYTGPYSVCSAGVTVSTCNQDIQWQGSKRIRSQIYTDIYIRYRMSGSERILGGALSNSEITFGMQNVFNREPPIVANSISVLGYSAYGDPRLRRFTLELKKHF